MTTNSPEYMREYRKKNRARIIQVQREWNERNADKLRAYNRDYQIERSDLIRERHREWRKTSTAYKAQSRRKTLGRLGVTVEFYEELLREQGGVCGLCGRPPPTGRRLAVDHCHRTNRIRGLLCHLCNTALGFVERYLADPAKIDDWIVRSPTVAKKPGPTTS